MSQFGGIDGQTNQVVGPTQSTINTIPTWSSTDGKSLGNNPNYKISSNALRISNTLVLHENGFISIGQRPARTGALRLYNNGGINFRDNTNNNDLNGVRLNTANNFLFGDVSAPNSYVYGGSNIILNISGTDILTISATLITAAVPVVLPSYTVAGAPAAGNTGAQIYVTDETDGAVPAFDDGTNWRRVTDREIIS